MKIVGKQLDKSLVHLYKLNDWVMKPATTKAQWIDAPDWCLIVVYVTWDGKPSRVESATHHAALVVRPVRKRLQAAVFTAR